MRLRIIRCFLLAALAGVCSCSVFRHQPQPGPKLYGYEPLGRLETVTYPCSVPGPSYRKMTVYLPPEYDSDTSARFPVVYLLHGARGSETTWTWRGYLPRLVDILYKKGTMVPAIIIMPDTNSFRNDKDYDNSRFKSALGCMLGVNGVVETGFADDVVRYVDTHFRTLPDKAHRAVAGMSIGGMQAAYLSANHPDMYGYVGLLSPIRATILKYNPKYNRFYLEGDKKWERQFNSDPPLKYFMMHGRGDLWAGFQVAGLHRHFVRRGYPHHYILTHASGHEWSCWWESLSLFLEECFQ